MKPHEWFGVFLRGLGVWEIIGGLQLIPQYWQSINKFQYKNEAELFHSLLLTGLSLAGIKIIIGVLLFVAAGWLTRLAYPAPEEKADQRQ